MCGLDAMTPTNVKRGEQSISNFLVLAKVVDIYLLLCTITIISNYNLLPFFVCLFFAPL